MSEQVSNEDMVLELVRFYLAYDEQPEYQEFYAVYKGILQMADHQLSFGWTAITDKGYEQIAEAYNALAELGHFDEKDPFDDLFEDND
jgi:hypothetical protein